MGLLFPPLRPSFDAALRDAKSKNPRARTAAAEALSSPPIGRGGEAKEALRPLVHDTDPSVRGAAMASLGGLKDEGAIDEIVGAFEDADPVVRQVALIAAADIGDARAVPAVRRMLRSDRPEVRFQAIATLVTLEPEQAVSDLERMTGDDDLEVRAHLADALSALEEPRAAAPLAELLGDANKAVRQAAAIGLARIGDARGVGALVTALDDKERCFEAAWALGELRAEEATEPLARVAGSFFKPLATKAAAGAALVRLGDPRGEVTLRAVLDAFRSDARSYAVQLVGELRLTALAPEIAALVHRPRGADLVVVAEALARLRERSPDQESPDEEGEAGRAVAQAALVALAKHAGEPGMRARELLA